MYRLFAVALTLIGCGSEKARAIASLEGDVVQGASLYATHCLTCHGEDGKSGSANEDIVHALHHGETHIIDGILYGIDTMPAFESILSDQDIADIMAFLHTLE